MIEIYGVVGAIALWEKLDYTSTQKLIDFKLEYNKEVNKDNSSNTNTPNTNQDTHKVSAEDINKVLKESGPITTPDGAIFDFSTYLNSSTGIDNNKQ